MSLLKTAAGLIGVKLVLEQQVVANELQLAYQMERAKARLSEYIASVGPYEPLSKTEKERFEQLKQKHPQLWDIFKNLTEEEYDEMFYYN